MYHQEELPLEIADDTADASRQPRPSIDERFDAFHASHPWVFEALEELMTEWVERGGGRISVKALFEQLRWSARDASGNTPLQLNNVFTSRYARLLRHEHPEWADAFELRRLRSTSAANDEESLTQEAQ
ncbi:hypothetical protein [Streptomyces sp. MUSC 14]|uniref:hypothetical protein n=1 Tax=Streptomyces sp. MUSC 14 TaxID=1354889 RepID=UPI0009A1264E|nr:hypothetical protein [Streptomyces sp. MUSC 14]